MLDEQNIAKLIVKSRIGSLSDRETRVLNDWIANDSGNRDLYDRMLNKDFAEDIDIINRIDSVAGYKKYIDKYGMPLSRTNIRPKIFGWMAASSAVLAVFVVITTLMLRPDITMLDSSSYHKSLVKATILTLADGRTIELNDAVNDSLSVIDGIDIDMQKATIVYQNAPVKKNELEYNTIETPIGAQYHVVLSDGTNVWIAPDTRLKFPVRFPVDKRMVYVEGEAYFDVAKSDSPMCISASNGVSIDVLGTAFNFKSYPDDISTEVVLERGVVRMNYQNNGVTMKPGELGVCSPMAVGSGDIAIEKADIEYHTAWRFKRLVFAEEPIASIMTKLKRWYDIDVRFSNTTDTSLLYSGDLLKTDDISTILNAFVETGKLKYEIKGNTVYIK